MRNGVIYSKYSFLFNPDNKPGIDKPSDVEEEALPSGRALLHSWHYHMHPGQSVVLFCHGNNGNLTQRGYMFHLARMSGFNLFIFDYAGYGRSTDTPSLPQLEIDAAAAYHHIVKKYKPKDIIVWGESLGSYVAMTIASRYECQRLLLMATFDSFDSILRHKDFSPIIKEFLARTVHAMTETSSNIEKAPKVKCPVLIIHSANDTLIPLTCAQRLFNSISCDKDMITISGDHATPRISYKDMQHVFKWCNLHCPSENVMIPWLECLARGLY